MVEAPKNQLEVKAEKTPVELRAEIRNKVDTLLKQKPQVKEFIAKDEKGVDRKMSVVTAPFTMPYTGQKSERIYVYTHMTPEEKAATIKDVGTTAVNGSNGPLQEDASKITLLERNSEGAIWTTDLSRQVFESPSRNPATPNKMEKYTAFEPVEGTNSVDLDTAKNPKEVGDVITNIEKSISTGTTYIAEQKAKQLQQNNNVAQKTDATNADKNLDKALASL